MLTKNDILNLYKKYDVSASKRFGQNFLYDQNIINKIVSEKNLEGKEVIEIGPGLGSLTRALLKEAHSVTSYEIDQDMIRVLKGEIKDSNFKLIDQDFLKANLDWEEKKEIIANIPYNITSKILFKLFENAKKISSAILMVQKEVGERLIANVSSSNYGKLTVTTQLFADIKKVTIVPKTSFIPEPKVTSMVIRLDFKNSEYNKELLLFIKNCFMQRRKTLLNNLKTFMSLEKAKELILKMKFKDSIRPQEISKDEYLIMFSLFKN